MEYSFITFVLQLLSVNALLMRKRVLPALMKNAIKRSSQTFVNLTTLAESETFIPVCDIIITGSFINMSLCNH